MQRRTRAAGASILLALCLGGPPAAASDAPATIPLLREAHAFYSGSTTPGSRWATVADALPKFLENAGIGAEDTAAFVEQFREGEHVAVVVWLGERPTGGYGVEFLRADSLPPGAITVWVAERRPPDGAIVTMALTSPVAAFLLPWNGETNIGVAWGSSADR